GVRNSHHGKNIKNSICENVSDHDDHVNIQERTYCSVRVLNYAMQYKDFAIILTWPDATIRGDEQWMMFFKKIGLVKNLNFKVGHTGIIIVKHDTGDMYFYDFGRYIAPRGYGRARSKFSDPLLEIKVKTKVIGNELDYLQEIYEHLELLKSAMYVEVKLLFLIVTNINFHTSNKNDDEWVLLGTYPYVDEARNNNTCSRFITHMLIN